MLHKTLLSLFLASLLSSCGSGPPVTIHISNTEAQGFDYSDSQGKKKGFKSYTDPSTDKLVCLTQEDARSLWEWYRDRCKK